MQYTWQGMLLFLVSGALAGIASAPTNCDKANLEAATLTGCVAGIQNDYGIQWTGIPYAEPPTGDRRWLAPEQKTSQWSGVRESFVPPGCIQACNTPPHTCPKTTSEDCLYLNVYAPSMDIQEPLPVMVWIHGGRFEQGAGDTEVYNGSWDSKFGEVVFVTINYRLGLLGFMYDEKASINGNMGFLDQVMALEWVQNNIANFGGDASRVTIFGQSAGGSSIASHLTSPKSAGLFHGAISESNPVGLSFQNTVSAQAIADSFKKHLDKTSACSFWDKRSDCYWAEGTSAETILAVQQKISTSLGQTRFGADFLQVFYPYTPVVDGNVMPLEPLVAYKTGKIHDVPIMMGTVQEEGWVFVYEVFTKPIKPWEFEGLLCALWIKNCREIIKHYAPDISIFGSEDMRPVLAKIASDDLFFCPTRLGLRSLSSKALRFGNDLFAYRYNHIAKDKSAWGPNYKMCWDHVCHAAELPLVFADYKFGLYEFTDDEKHLSTDMSTAWTNFAHSGNPNIGPNDLSFTWPTFSTETFERRVEFKTPQSEIVSNVDATCNFWDEIGYVPICMHDECN